MNALSELLRPPPSEYAARLASEEPDQRPRRRPVLLCVLLLLCFAPRAIVACRSGAICPDGAWYVQVADAIARGDVAAALSMEHLNIYPILLSFGARLGADPQFTGETIGVACGTLAILPLFGLLRRQFDDSVATVACGIYALHPKLIEWSTELVRDSTFWLLMTLTLYCAWRAATSALWRWYLAAGAAWTLAVHTRFEGWFLLIPVLGWSAVRAWKATEQARKLRLGAAIAVATCPLFLLVANVTWLRNLDRWEFGDFDRMEYVLLWAGSTFDRVQSLLVLPAAAAEPLPSSESWRTGKVKPVAPRTARSRTRISELVWQYVDANRRGMTSLFFVLLCWGVVRWRGTWRLPEHRLLFYPAMLVFLGIWIHLWYAQATSSRYSLSVVILGSPFIALGALDAGRMASGIAARVTPRATFAGTFLAMAAPLAAVGLAMTARADVGREREASVGRWIQNEFGDGASVVANGRSQLLTYYSRAALTHLEATETDFEVVNELRATNPQVAVVWKRSLDARYLPEVLDQAHALGYVAVAAADLPAPCGENDVVILTKQAPSNIAARAADKDLR